MPQAATLAQHSTARHSGIIASIFNFIDCFFDHPSKGPPYSFGEWFFVFSLRN